MAQEGKYPKFKGVKEIIDKHNINMSKLRRKIKEENKKRKKEDEIDFPTRQTINNWHHGRTDVKYSKLKLVAQILSKETGEDISLDDLRKYQ